jgi:hypothetical protein
MKIHEKLELLIEAFVNESDDGAVLGLAREWREAGKPVVEEADAEDKHPKKRCSCGHEDPGFYRPCLYELRRNELAEKDEKIKELEKVRAGLLADRDTLRNRCRDLEAKLEREQDIHNPEFYCASTAHNKVRNAALEEAADRLKELEAKLANRESETKKLIWEGAHKAHDDIRNAALEEAAKEADKWGEGASGFLASGPPITIDQAIEGTRANFRRYAARIRELKK